MKYLLILVLCVGTFMVNGQDKAKAYIDAYKDVAIAEMRRTGVPAAITLAQGLVESGCGEGDLCKRSNNHFGIKCKTGWTGDKVYHDDDEKSECFRSYTSGIESYKDHSDFLKNREPYADLFKLDPVDYKGWAYGLKRAGYATERDYPQKLIKVINDYNLNQYSLIAIYNKPATADSLVLVSNEKPVLKGLTKANPSPVASVDSSVTTVTSITTKVITDTALLNKTQQASLVVAPIEKAEDSVVIINAALTNTIKKDTATTNYPAGMFTINHSSVIYVSEGTSYLSIASIHNIALAKLFEFNDIEESEITTKPQLIYLEKKQSRGSIDSYIAIANEGLLDISQKEGVRLDKILEYNKLKKDSIVKVGDKIMLRPMVTYGVSK